MSHMSYSASVARRVIRFIPITRVIRIIRIIRMERATDTTQAMCVTGLIRRSRIIPITRLIRFIPITCIIRIIRIIVSFVLHAQLTPNRPCV